MKKTIATLALFVSFAAAAQAQGVRQQPQSNTTQENAQQQLPKPAPAPNSFAAQYAGGLIGFSKKEKGTLNFDDLNKRIVFRNKENKELFALSYNSFIAVYPDSRSYRPTGATVASIIPLPGAGLLGLIRSKARYLIVQFDDPDSDAKGTASFKLDNKEILRSVIYTIGDKAELKARGDAFYRPKQGEVGSK